MVGAAVAEGQLVGLEADGAAEQLVAEADAEERALADQLADGVDDVVERRRVAGAVGEEDDVGVLGEHLLGRGGAGQQGQPGAVLAQLADDVELDPGVDPDHVRAARPSKRTGSGGVTVRARSAPSIEGSAATRSRASASGVAGGEDAAAHRAAVADVADQGAGVDAADPRHAAVVEPVEPAALGAWRRPRCSWRRA